MQEELVLVLAYYDTTQEWKPNLFTININQIIIFTPNLYTTITLYNIKLTDTHQTHYLNCK